jgi:hypothetical protein
VSRASLVTILQRSVPGVDVLKTSTADMRSKQSTVTRNRLQTASVQLWAGPDRDGFWTAQRHRIIMVMADAAHDHAKDKRYIEKMTHTRAAYADLCAILAGRECSPFQRGASCDFCKGRGTLACDFLWMVAWEAVDMFTRVVLDYVNEDPSERRLQSPRGDEVVPIESTNALYNMAGALLLKVKKLRLAKRSGCGVSALRLPWHLSGKKRCRWTK